jgi:hypothetical protein
MSLRVLDCGGGPASFTAEMSASGLHAVSVDPIYAYSGLEIQSRFEKVVQPMIAQVRATPDDWIWSYHHDSDELCANRRAALRMFLGDYEQGLQARRYITGELPSLAFDEGSFGLAVCSHLLFLYSDLLSEEFHIRALTELCRVADEVRIFPLRTLARKASPHFAAMQATIRSQGMASEVIRVNYESQRGGNELLRIFKS